MEILNAAEFLNKRVETCLVDVRSPAEFQKGHIPGAFNLPIFEDDERAVIGILYKNQGRSEAVRKGLELVAPKMTNLVERAFNLARNQTILVHCWRGGMRSSSVAWLFETAGLKTFTLEGGYKAYRNYIRNHILDSKSLVVLGGLTGSGKTLLLRALAAHGEPVVDLENLAKHRGSVFGGAGLPDQPSTEQFENDLFDEIDDFPPGTRIWVEDESKRIGAVFQPDLFYKQLRNSPLVFIEVSADERTEILVEEYSRLPHHELKQAILRLEKRLGNLEVKNALQALEGKQFEQVVACLLPYYDKLYSKGVGKSGQRRILGVDLKGMSSDKRLQELSSLRKSIDN